MKFDVVGLGTVVVDFEVLLREFPRANTKNEVTGSHVQIGGPVPTALALLSRFGLSCSFIGSWGQDRLGEMIEADFADCGIDFSWSSITQETRTGFAHVWIDQSNGSRTVAYDRSNTQLSSDKIDCTPLRSCRALHLDGWPTEAALLAARTVSESGGLVCLDTGSPKPGMEQLIPYVEVINCPRHFLPAFLNTEDFDVGAARLLEMGPRIVTVTSGSQGAALWTKDTKIEMPAFPIRAVDTTGAGDVFSGALIYAAMHRWPSERMVMFAAAAAAMKCSAIGNRDALPKLKDVLQRIGPY